MLPIVEEVLYPAMEDYELDLMIGGGPAARSIKLELKPFTLVGATTRAGLLTAPLRVPLETPLEVRDRKALLDEQVILEATELG